MDDRMVADRVDVVDIISVNERKADAASRDAGRMVLISSQRQIQSQTLETAPGVGSSQSAGRDRPPLRNRS